MTFKREAPPWLKSKLAAKLARLRRIKRKGLAPVPTTKAEQRELLKTFKLNN